MPIAILGISLPVSLSKSELDQLVVVYSLNRNVSSAKILLENLTSTLRQGFHPLGNLCLIDELRITLLGFFALGIIGGCHGSGNGAGR